MKRLLLTLAVISAVNADEALKPNDTYAESRSLLADMAHSFFSRQETSSQVVSLNLTNLFILVMLKALIYAAGSYGGFGGGHGAFGGHGGFLKARSLNETGFHMPTFSEAELLLFMGYLTSSSDNYECLNRVACDHPKLAERYLTGGKLMLKAAKAVKSIVPYSTPYEKMVEGMNDAVKFGNANGPCERRYRCSMTRSPESHVHMPRSQRSEN